jgi:sugar phosphate isomerase/epimerase
MNAPIGRCDRRQFHAASLSAAAILAVGSSPAAAAEPADKKRKYCAFIKFLTSLKYDELAERIAALGFDGVEVTVRGGDSYIRPEEAAAELPKFKQVLDKHGLEITIVTTDILRPNQKHADAVLRAAVDAGVPRYRLGFASYDLGKPIVEQVQALRIQFAALAALNRKIGITGMYQNHSGAEMFGATLWDLYYVLRELPPDELGCVYDLRHAAVEAGEAWPTLYAVMKPHIRAYSVKDYTWKGRKSGNSPLGQGSVDPDFYKRLARAGYEGPISLHVEYVEQSAGADAQLAAIQRDYATLRSWMND